MGPITNVVMCCKYVQLLLSLFLMAKWLTNGVPLGFMISETNGGPFEVIGRQAYIHT